MKKGLFTLCVVTAILISCMALLSGCSLFGGGGDADNTTPTPKEYTIQYTDDIGTQQITVT